MKKPTTGKYSIKPYQCNECQNVENHGTNHWGEIYNIRCKECGWKTHLSTFTCLESCPETHDMPEKWQIVKLGDLFKIAGE